MNIEEKELLCKEVCTKCNGSTMVIGFDDEQGIIPMPCMDCVETWDGIEGDVWFNEGEANKDNE